MTKEIEIPLVKATNENLKGYGYLIDSFENSDIEIVTWPKQGWRDIEEGTGNEGGTTEGSFDTWWQGDVLYGQNNAVQHKSCLLYTSPSPRDQLTSRMPSSA